MGHRTILVVLVVNFFLQAGQEKFRTVTATYYRATHGILVVYDITDPESFQDCQSTWLDEVNRFFSKVNPRLFIYLDMLLQIVLKSLLEINVTWRINVR